MIRTEVTPPDADEQAITAAARPAAEVRLRQWMPIAAAAVMLRAIVFAAVCLRAHLSLDQYARLYDGNSYLITAEAMSGDRHEFNDFHGRVFPGYPALMAIGHRLGLPLAVAAVGGDWLCAAAAAVFAAMLFSDRRVGWAMVMLIPHYLMNSSMALSEAPLLAFTLGGLLLARRNSEFCGGALVGIAGLIRPMACFAMLGHTIADVSSRKWSLPNRFVHIGTFVIATAAVFITGLFLVQYWRGDAFANARYYANSPAAYGGDLLTWPFHSLVMVPIQRHVPIARVLYMYGHVFFTLIACGVLARRFIRHRHSLDYRDALAGPWLWSNTLFALCTGSVWGFECFHRFTIPALPAMFWGLHRLLPRRRGSWIVLAILCTVIAVMTALH